MDTLPDIVEESRKRRFLPGEQIYDNGIREHIIYNNFHKFSKITKCITTRNIMIATGVTSATVFIILCLTRPQIFKITDKKNKERFSFFRVLLASLSSGLIITAILIVFKRMCQNKLALSAK